MLCNDAILYLSDIALGYGLDDRGFESRKGLGISLFITASRPVLGPTRPPIQCVPRAKRPTREANPSPPPSAEVKECVELYFHSSRTLSWPGAELKHRESFAFNDAVSTAEVMQCQMRWKYEHMCS
jgi:hypothetical protein